MYGPIHVGRNVVVPIDTCRPCPFPLGGGAGVESKRKREEPWGAWNLAVNIIRLVVDVVRLFWHNIP